MRTERFAESILKIQRAKQHIADLQSTLVKWVTADDFHTVKINRDFRRKIVYLRIEFDELTFPSNTMALLIGDALHNLRSALDFLWYQVVLDCHGEPTDWTRFPISRTREKLEPLLKSALKQNQIMPTVRNFVLNTIKPYEAGNYPLWALHRLNIRDKHELLIPVLQMVMFTNVCLEDDQNTIHLAQYPYFMDQSSSIRLDKWGVVNPWNRKFTITHKGEAAATVIFQLDMPFEGEPVIPSLHRIAEEVTRTVEAFDILL